MKQIDREMKQNLLGRCPKGKVRIHQLKSVEKSNELTISIPGILDETVKSLMETSLNIFPNGKDQKRGKKCKVCGKEGHPTDIRRHIEAFHVEGVEIPCKHCGKICKSRNSLRKHIANLHRRQ